MILTIGFFAYPRLKKVAYGSMATFFILRIGFESIAILILEIVWVCFGGLFFRIGGG
jgi:hypothetical protein